MAEIIKVYRQNIGALRFIGKKYNDSDRMNGTFSLKWREWFENNWFEVIEKQIDKSIKGIYEDGDAYIGLMRDKNGEFEYWIGIFMPNNTGVPDGFSSVDFSEGELGVCWVYGKEDAVYCWEEKCRERLITEGFAISGEWCFERYVCPRFTTPDEKGNIILDICFCVK